VPDDSQPIARCSYRYFPHHPTMFLWLPHNQCLPPLPQPHSRYISMALHYCCCCSEFPILTHPSVSSMKQPSDCMTACSSNPGHSGKRKKAREGESITNRMMDRLTRDMRQIPTRPERLYRGREQYCLARTEVEGISGCIYVGLGKTRKQLLHTAPVATDC
jgi:hypothetical protein